MIRQGTPVANGSVNLAYFNTMKQLKKTKVVLTEPTITGRDTRAELLERNTRTTVPIRKVFVQRPRGETPRHGPLQTFVANGDLRGLRAYLIIVAASGGEREDGWTTELDSMVWARLFDAERYATPQAARTAAWRTLGRLEERGLLRRARERGARKIAVTLLREDGSGDPYTRPDGAEISDRFLRLPTALWKRGLDEQLTLPGLAMLLVIAAEKPWSSFPADRMEQWYGWSADTTQRGVKNLLSLKLIERREAYRKAPLSPTGSTLLYQYRLVGWMRPKAGARPDGSQK